MPRALTEQEKCRLCNRLLEKGKAIVLAQGIKKVSVDDIAKAAGMAKGSFYQHFESKEVFLYELINDIHKQ
ncbi:MAG: TetR/AcrR family transcriptional regulator, partial [Treponema sp.]|nr:TetR/AcrR family transcriptional regulator [Treponema sp.]